MGGAAVKPICCAAQDGNLDDLRTLLETACDPNVRDQPGAFSERLLPRTPLMYAAQQGHAEVVALLLQFGADADMRNEAGGTAAHLAAAQGHIEPLAVLTMNRPDTSLTARDGNGSTTLHIAATKANEELVLLLLGFKADCMLEDEKGNLPLHGTKDLKVLEALLEASPGSINAQNRDGHRVLHLATKEGNHRHVELLLERRADPCARTSSGHTVLRLACNAAERSGDGPSHLQCAALLLGHNAMVEPGDALAARKHHPLDMLLQAWTKRQPPHPPAPPVTETEKDQEIERLTAKLEALQKAKDEEATRLACCICMVTQRQVLYLPCKHIACCRQCANLITECPLDREPIRDMVLFTLA